MHSIYLITNKITNKKYVGYTSIELKERLIGHISAAKCGSKFLLHQSIRKYGWENFTAEVIYQSENGDHTLKVMEPHFIKEHKSFGSGYNMTPGGEGSGPCSPEKAAKISASNKGKPRPGAGNKLAKGKIWINNGVDSNQHNPVIPIPEGWKKGRIMGQPGPRLNGTKRPKFEGGYKNKGYKREFSAEHKAKISASLIGTARAKGNKNVNGTIWVNNGVINKRVLPDSLPDGFKRGKL